MEKNAIKQQLYTAVDQYADVLRTYVDDTTKMPELGFDEYKSAERLANELEALGLSVKKEIALTGVRADITSSKEGPTVAILGELDGIVCQKAPHANPENGASHTCGHNLQTTIALACAAALCKTKLMEELCGKVSIIGTPAEEFIEVDKRNNLRKAGKITYFSGKQEMVRLGEFDDVDMSMMIHAGDSRKEAYFNVPEGGNGFRIFMLQVKGQQAHAAAAPHKGVNALYAAIAGINAVNALRETFRDKDHVRVHYIITKGGDSPNSVPDDVRLEGYVRASSMDVIDATFAKVIRAFKCGAEALGAECLVNSIAGYLPLNTSKALNDIFIENAAELIGMENIVANTVFFASTDMGDIAHIMPAIHPMAGGTVGPFHASTFELVDFEAAILTPAKALLGSLVDVLYDDAKVGKDLLANFTPVYTKEAYLEAMDSRFYSEIP